MIKISSQIDIAAPFLRCLLSMNLIRLAAECSCSAQRVAAIRDKLSHALLDLAVNRPPPARRRPFRKSRAKPCGVLPLAGLGQEKYGPWFRVQHGIGRPSDLERVERKPAPDVEIIPPPPGL